MRAGLHGAVHWQKDLTDGPNGVGLQELGLINLGFSATILQFKSAILAFSAVVHASPPL